MSKPDRANHPARKPNLEGPAQRVSVEGGHSNYEFDVPVGASKENVGDHIRTHITAGNFQDNVKNVKWN